MTEIGLEVLAPLEISLFCGLRPFLQFLTGLASNGMSGYIKNWLLFNLKEFEGISRCKYFVRHIIL
jgi:hypothetical protein